ncbi:mitogen-activated protein kinase kinase kinase NPK1 [Rhodamnia argentea]|uniref:mitogen-activated protein kinase kinase kinase n=1 Tax=Rhodamnia argentea TaxID=178133 RepID=A0A8B8PJF5_9MYRT|nr:mitogen-activated protein kinase kinase kinase NPK1 [Rhodamnia argentea]
MFESLRRSIVFRPSSAPDADEAPGPVASTSTPTTPVPTTTRAIVEKFNSCIRKSIAFSKVSPSAPKDNAPAIRWRKGELIGCGAFGRVYMGMNLDSGELLAVKQVLIAANSASKEKAQAHIRGLEEEVKLLKNLSHPNIVRYLGTVREEDSLNILLEFVPGGSISSLLGKFGPFPETVIRTYTKQLLLGLEYLHKNGIMHRDIKGANILVDNKGCIKLADFGASKQVVELATISGAKSMKGTPYWMAPEVILQTGHSFSADVWSVGCTVIEMATGKPPWSDQYQEVAALFYIGTTKSHPPIPDHLSEEAKDFLLQCLQKEPHARRTASQLLQHHFVTGEHEDSHSGFSTLAMEKSDIPSASSMANGKTIQMSMNLGADIANMDSMSCSTFRQQRLTANGDCWGAHGSDDDMCLIDDEIDSIGKSPADIHKSLNPISEPSIDWTGKFDVTPVPQPPGMGINPDRTVISPTGPSGSLSEGGKDFSFPSGPSILEEDDELTESKITAFLHEKAMELKKLQTPLYEEFFNSLNTPCSPAFGESKCDENAPSYLRLPPKSRSPSRAAAGTSTTATDGVGSGSPGSNNSRRISNVGNASNQSSPDVGLPQSNDLKGLANGGLQDSSSPSFSERQKIWKEELDQELKTKREMMRQAGVGATNTPSPRDRTITRQRERTRFASPGK